MVIENSNKNVNNCRNNGSKVLAGPIILIGQTVHGQGVIQAPADVNCYAHTVDFNLGCDYGVYDCSHKSHIMINLKRLVKTTPKDTSMFGQMKVVHCNKQILT